eukprot:COSAG05_NODE_303_length_11737_cov_116.354270_3_plen_31_part_00
MSEPAIVSAQLPMLIPNERMNMQVITIFRT